MLLGKFSFTYVKEYWCVCMHMCMLVIERDRGRQRDKDSLQLCKANTDIYTVREMTWSIKPTEICTLLIILI